MLRVQNNDTKEIFLMQDNTDGVTLYSTVDHSGESDKIISYQELENNFKILKKIEN